MNVFSFKFYKKWGNGCKIFTIGDNFPLEFDTSVGAQLSIEEIYVHFLTLRAVTYTNTWKPQHKTINTNNYSYLKQYNFILTFQLSLYALANQRRPNIWTNQRPANLKHFTSYYNTLTLLFLTI